MKKEKKRQKENRTEVKRTIDSYRDTRASQIAQVIAEIGNVEHLTADDLVSISRRLFKLVSFCDCIRTENGHNCGKFNHHDHELNSSDGDTSIVS
jgi:hypothetical protein